MSNTNNKEKIAYEVSTNLMWTLAASSYLLYLGLQLKFLSVNGISLNPKAGSGFLSIFSSSWIKVFQVGFTALGYLECVYAAQHLIRHYKKMDKVEVTDASFQMLRSSLFAAGGTMSFMGGSVTNIAPWFVLAGFAVSGIKNIVDLTTSTAALFKKRKDENYAQIKKQHIAKIISASFQLTFTGLGIDVLIRSMGAINALKNGLLNFHYLTAMGAFGAAYLIASKFLLASNVTAGVSAVASTTNIAPGVGR